MTGKGLWKWFRKNEKLILAGIVVLIVPAFGFGGILVASVARSKEDTTSAVIDGEELSIHEMSNLERRFSRLVRNTFDLVSSQSQRRPEMKLTKMDVYKHFLLVRKARDMGIRVTDEEVDEIITDYQNASVKLPFITDAYKFMSNHEISVYNHTLYFQLVTRIKPAGAEYSEERFRGYLARMNLTDAEFRTTIREILSILKFKYFLWNTTVVSTDRAFENFRKNRVAHQCAYVRFDASDFKKENEEVDEKALEEYYSAHRNEFLEPFRKKVEYACARTEDIRKRVFLTAGEKRTFYENEKETLFRIPEEPGKEEDEEASGEEEKGGTGGAGGGEEGGPEKDKDVESDEEDKEAGPAEGSEEEKAEIPEVKIKPFDDPEVTAEIEKRLSERKARDFLDHLMRRIAGTVKRLEEDLRRDPATFRNPDPELRSEIDFSSIARNIAESPDWVGSYVGYRFQAVRDDRFRSREEIREAFGPIGPRIADKAWELKTLTVSDVIPVPGGFVFFRVIEDQPQFVLPLPRIRQRVLDDLLLGRALDRALEKAKSIVERMKKSSFETVAREDDLNVRKTVFFRSTASTIPGDGEHPPVGEAATFIAAAFAPDAKQVSRPIVEREIGAVFCLRAVAVKYPSAAEMPSSERARFIEEERRKVWGEVNGPWGDEFRKHHKIEDKTRDRKRRRGTD